MKSSVTIKMSDQNDNTVTTNINFFNAAKLPIGYLGTADTSKDYSSDTTAISTAIHGLVALTVNTYEETTLTYSATIEELLYS